MNWLHRGDLSDRIPEFIRLGEAKLNSKLQIANQRTSATINPSTTYRYVSLPTGFRNLIAFNDDLGEPLQQIQAKTLEDIAYSADADRPQYFYLSSRINFECVADQSYDFTMHYWQRLDLASDSTNYVLTNYPDCYLYSALLAAEPFLNKDSRTQLWAELLADAVKSANSENRPSIPLRTEMGARGYDIYSDR